MSHLVARCLSDVCGDCGVDSGNKERGIFFGASRCDARVAVVVVFVVVVLARL